MVSSKMAGRVLETENMTTRWKRSYEKQMESPKLRELVESDLNEYHTKLIVKGLRAAEEGRFVSRAEMKRTIKRMGRSK